MQNPKNLIWLDLEMTGLDTQNDHILEIATVITDSELTVLADGPVIAIYQPDDVLASMPKWCQHYHGQSGLIERCRSSHKTLAEAEAETLAFLAEYVPAGKSPLCGNSICQDRRFLARLMPDLEAYFHYRHIDVSTLKELVKRWHPAQTFNKQSTHQALADIHDSIEELRHYRRHFFLPTTA